MKPYVICHMVSSVDGRILASRWRPEGASRFPWRSGRRYREGPLMDEAAFNALGGWVTEAGLIGRNESELMAGSAGGSPMPGCRWRAPSSFSTPFTRFTRAARSAGAPIARNGRAVDYGRTNEGEAAENWRRSPFSYLLQSGDRRCGAAWLPADPADFPTVEQARDEGMTDYLRAHSPICRRGRDRRNGLRLFVLVDRCGGRLWRGRKSPR